MSNRAPDLPQTFRIQRIAYLAVPMMFVVAIVLAGTSMTRFGWTFVVPVALAWWIMRIRTVVTAEGIRAVHTFATREVRWDEVEGLQFRRWGSVEAVLVNKARVRLPAVAFTDLPRLSEASHGRIPDPYAAAAADS